MNEPTSPAGEEPYDDPDAEPLLPVDEAADERASVARDIHLSKASGAVPKNGSDRSNCRKGCRLSVVSRAIFIP